MFVLNTPPKKNPRPLHKKQKQPQKCTLHKKTKNNNPNHRPIKRTVVLLFLYHRKKTKKGRWRKTMPKQEMVVYEIVRDKKIPKILKIENENIAVCRGGYIRRQKEYEIDIKKARMQIKRSMYFGRKDFAIFRDSRYPYIMRAVDTESREHVFWVDKDRDAEELMRCGGKGW